jgi:RHS repeat-associated protein
LLQEAIASTSQSASQYEYGPFGELLRATGPLAQTFHHLFSTKYFDWETGLSYYGHRYYHPHTGTWPNRDPIGEDDGPNVYAYGANNPVTFIDPWGLWKWKNGKRQGGERATMIPEEGDTTESAATFKKLDASETEKWLRDSTGHGVKPGEKIKTCLEYDSPNTVVIGVGYGAFATTFLARWQNQVTAAAEKRGFYVAAYRFDTGTASHELEAAARGRDVWGLGLFGHGYKKINGWFDWSADPDFAAINGGLAWDDDKSQIITPATIRPHHQFGLMIAYFCYADLQPWSGLVSPNGKYYGGNGSLSVLSGPRGVGYWGSWDGLVGSAAD